jgi:hypothetical protein
MAPSKDAMQLMKSSIKLAQQFRALKSKLDPKLKDRRKEMKSLVSSIAGIKKRLDEAMDEINLLAEREQTVGPKHLEYRSALITDYQAKGDEYQRLRKKSQKGIQTLRKAEKRWISHMRSLTDIHDQALVNCGLLEDDEESSWTDSAYKIDELDPAPTFINFIPNSSDRSDHETIVEAEDVDFEAAEMRKQHRDHERELQDAYVAHDDHRDKNEQDLYILIQGQKHRGRDASDKVLANEFAPIHLAKGQKLIADVKSAEDALAKFEHEAWDAGIPLHTLGWHATAGAYEAAIELEGKSSLVDLDRNKVEQWMNTEMDAVSLAETVPDSLEEGVAGTEGSIRNNYKASETHEPEV